jgi:tetratricopeptide (TPR) repeat protein
MKVYKMKERWGPYQQAAIDWMYANDFESPQEGIKYLRQQEQIDDQDPSVYFRFGMNYLALKQYNLAIPAWEKAVKIYHSWGADDIYPNYLLGLSYHKAGQYKKEGKFYKKINKFIPENPWILTGQALLAFAEKDTVRANRYIEKYISFKKEKSYPEASIEEGLGDIYFQAGDLKEGRDHYMKAISLSPEVPYGYFNLANFLIDSNYSLDEVPGLLDKAMELAANKVDYYNYMATKGWALFKQGKNQEALEILQKAWDKAPYKLYSIRSRLEEVKKVAKEQGII